MVRKLGVGIAAYSPLVSGFLSRTFTKKEEINDWRQKMPRFSEENFEKNAKKCEELEKYSQQKGVTLLSQSQTGFIKEDFMFFPQKNSQSAFINLTKQECQEIRSSAPDASGFRYDKERMELAHSFGSI